MRLGAQLKISNSKFLTRTVSAVRYVRHANIVQRVKTCYKIKIDYRESKSCFYGFLQHQSHHCQPSKAPKCPHSVTFTV